VKTVLKRRQSRDCAFPQPNRHLTAGPGGNFVSAPHFGTIAKSVMKSRFGAISFDFCDFTPIQPDFTPIQPDFTHFLFFSSDSTRNV